MTQTLPSDLPAIAICIVSVKENTTDNDNSGYFSTYSMLSCENFTISYLCLRDRLHPSVSDNSAMVLAILFSLKRMELLDNGLQPNSGATPLF